MKKVLILAYFFPPCGLTSANRVASWTNYFADKDIYPIVITRKWENNTNETKSIYEESSKNIEIVEHDKFEVHYLPYSPKIQEKLFIKYRYTKLSILYHIARFIVGFINKWFDFPIPFSNFYTYSKTLIKSKNISSVIISAFPFMLFKFGYQLKKEFPNLKWLADYRDDWTTNQLRPMSTIAHKLFNRFELIYEKKWVSTAEIVTSVTKQYTKNVAEITNNKGFVIYNGYQKEFFNTLNTNKNSSQFTLLYSGTVFENQPIEQAITIVKKLIDEGYKIKLKMPGATLYEDVAKKLNELAKGYEEHIQIIDRVDRAEIVKLMNECDALFLTAYGKLNTVLPSKLFEYIGNGKPIIMYPSDNGEIAEILNSISNTFVLNKAVEFEEILKTIIKSDGNHLLTPEEKKTRSFYSRKTQAFKMAELVNEYL